MHGGLKILPIRRDSIESCPLLLIRHAGSRFARDATPCELSRVVKCLTQIEWSLLTGFKNEEGSRIIISRNLTSSSANGRRANRVESKSATDESTHFGRKVKEKLKIKATLTKYWNKRTRIIWIRTGLPVTNLKTVGKRFHDVLWSHYWDRMNTIRSTPC